MADSQVALMGDGLQIGSNPTTLTFTGFAPGTYDVYIYAGESVDAWAVHRGSSYPVGKRPWTQRPEFIEGLNYGRFRTAPSPSGSITFDVAAQWTATINGVQFVTCASATPFGNGCLGTGGTLRLSARNLPSIGSSYLLDADNLTGSLAAIIWTGFNNTSSGAGRLPLDMTPFGFGPGCTLLCSPDLTQWAPVSTGAATVMLPLPADPRFVGVTLYHQAASVDNGAAGGLAFSNAINSLVGL